MLYKFPVSASRPSFVSRFWSPFPENHPDSEVEGGREEMERARYPKIKATFLPFTIYHKGFFHSVRRNPSELSPKTPVSGYSWPRRTQVADKAVSPSCFRSSLPPCPFSWCPLCHSFCPSVDFESCNVSRHNLV